MFFNPRWHRASLSALPAVPIRSTAPTGGGWHGQAGDPEHPDRECRERRDLQQVFLCDLYGRARPSPAARTRTRGPSFKPRSAEPPTWWKEPPPPAEPQIFCDDPQHWRAAYYLAYRWVSYAYQMLDKIYRQGLVSQSAAECLWSEAVGAPPVFEEWEGDPYAYLIGYPLPWYWFGPFDWWRLQDARYVLGKMLDWFYGRPTLRIVCGEQAAKAYGSAAAWQYQCPGDPRLGNAGRFPNAWQGLNSVNFCHSPRQGFGPETIRAHAEILIHEISHQEPLPNLHHYFDCGEDEDAGPFYGTEGARFLVENCPEATTMNPDNFRFFAACVGRSIDAGELRTWGRSCMPPQVLPPKKP